MTAEAAGRGFSHLYLHIGGDAALRSAEIIGLFDFDGASRGRDTRAFLRRREKDGRLIQAGGEALPRSFAVTASDTVVLSPVTTETLNKRLSETGKKAWTR